VILPLLLALLAFAVLVPIVLPLLRVRGADTDPSRFDQAVYRDQLRELDRDIARGLLTEAEARTSRLEIQRRLLAAADRAQSPGGAGGESHPPLRGGQTPWLALAIAGFVAIGSVGLYDILSQPTRLPVPGGAQRAEVERLVAQVKERLAGDPTNLDLWRHLARSAAALADWDTAIDAYRRSMALGDGTVETQAAYAEVLVARAGGTVVPAARDAFRAVLDRDPGNGMARFYLALATGQEGHPVEAIAQLQALAGDLPQNAPVRPELARQVHDLATQAGIAPPALAAGRPVVAEPGTGLPPSPDQATMEAAAAMPAADRAQMIRGMVTRLEERLAHEPGDFEGWMRLGQSWTVLRERDKAADAYETAAALRPEDVSVPLRAVEVLLQGVAVSDPLPPRAIAILRRIETVQPNEPAVLWYLGLVAAREGRKDVALGYWRRLRDGLPSDHPDAAMVRKAIEALGGS
jgi:cytochrome c-type biogenesis protein CcmH